MAAPKTSSSDVLVGASGFSYVARQPILTVNEKVYGYELLFRDGIENHFRETDADSASRRTLDTSLQIGIDLLCDSRRAFVNCTREILIKDYMTLLPPTSAVVEVLESVPVDDLVVTALKRLKQAGYLVALDDFVFNDPRDPLTEFADIIKVDIQQTTPEHYATMITKYGTWLRHLLAEKVETREEFTATKEAGFTYFQGYFFRRPEVLQTKEIPASRLNYLRLLGAVSQPELNHREFESIIKHEVSICYRLLRHLNSAAFGIQSEVHSVAPRADALG